MISAMDVSVGYDGTLVIEGVGLRAERGEVIGLIGPNGSGKSTFLKTLYAALRPRTGHVTVDGRPVTSLSGAALARRLAVVAQETPSDVPFTVADMVLLGRAPHRGPLASFDREDHRVVAAALSRVGVRELASRQFSTLSGGEKQRVLVARTLAQQADHLLLDEPTNHLDIRCQHDILRLVKELDVTTVVVLHDLNLAARYCDALVMLAGGRVVGAGDPEQVLTTEAVREVYHMDVERVQAAGCVQFIFSPVVEDAPPAGRVSRHDEASSGRHPPVSRVPRHGTVQP